MLIWSADRSKISAELVTTLNIKHIVEEVVRLTEKY